MFPGGSSFHSAEFFKLGGAPNNGFCSEGPSFPLNAFDDCVSNHVFE